MGLTNTHRIVIQAELNHCNKCGFCLPACPTYLLTGNELASPRGRLAMAEAAVGGDIPLDKEVAEVFSQCLGCRACETACPSGVGYGQVYEAVREALFTDKPSNTRPTFTRPLYHMVKRRALLRKMVRLGRPIKRLLPQSLRSLTPQQAVASSSWPHNGQATATFFLGCISDAVYGQANDAAIDLLQKGGYRVNVPPKQTCCGALHMHAGDRRQAQELARRNIAAFDDGLPLINHAGGCGAFLKDYGHLLADDHAWAERAQKFSQRVWDLTEGLDNAPARLQFQGTGQRVALQNSCHLVNVQHLGDRPKAWMSQVQGDTYLPLPGTDQCCGSAGLYNVVQPEWAEAILQKKMAEVQDAKPDILIVNNPGCALQMEHGSQDNGGPPVQFLSVYLRDRLRPSPS